jgi:hypothetical protein
MHVSTRERQQTLQRVLAIDTLHTFERHQAIDLDWFLGLPRAEQAATWHGWNETAKTQAATLLLQRTKTHWDAETVKGCVERLNGRWS